MTTRTEVKAWVLAGMALVCGQALNPSPGEAGMGTGTGKGPIAPVNVTGGMPLGASINPAINAGTPGPLALPSPNGVVPMVGPQNAPQAAQPSQVPQPAASPATTEKGYAPAELPLSMPPSVLSGSEHAASTIDKAKTGEEASAAPLQKLQATAKDLEKPKADQGATLSNAFDGQGGAPSAQTRDLSKSEEPAMTRHAVFERSIEISGMPEIQAGEPSRQILDLARSNIAKAQDAYGVERSVAVLRGLPSLPGRSAVFAMDFVHALGRELMRDGAVQGLNVRVNSLGYAQEQKDWGIQLKREAAPGKTYEFRITLESDKDSIEYNGSSWVSRESIARVFLVVKDNSIAPAAAAGVRKDRKSPGLLRRGVARVGALVGKDVEEFFGSKKFATHADALAAIKALKAGTVYRMGPDTVEFLGLEEDGVTPALVVRYLRRYDPYHFFWGEEIATVSGWLALGMTEARR